MAWGFLCSQSRLVDQDHQKDFKARCAVSPDAITAADALNIRRYCLQAQIRVVKTIRFAHAGRGATDSLKKLSARPNFSVRLLHVVRHPFKVISSQYKHAWYETLQFRQCERGLATCNATSEPSQLNPTQTMQVSTHLVKLGGMVCELMTNVTTAMHGLKLGAAAQVVRYEDLALPYTFSTFNAVLNFLGVMAFFPEASQSGDKAHIIINHNGTTSGFEMCFPIYTAKTSALS